MNMTVCERIDAILQERGMSRRKLAIKAGIAPSSLQSAMARNTGLSLDMLVPVANVLGISSRILVEGEEQPNKPTICLILGVEVGERFRIHGMEATFWITKDGTFCTEPPNVAGSSRALLYALENPALVKRCSTFTKDEIALCRQLHHAGARWLARGKHLRWYMKRPFLRNSDGKWDMKGDWGTQSGKLPYKLMPSVQKGAMVSLEDVLNKIEGGK